MVRSHPAPGSVSRTSQNRSCFATAGTRRVRLRQWSHLQKRTGAETNCRWRLRGNGRCDSLCWALKDLVGQIWRKMFGEVGAKEGERCRRVCLEMQHFIRVDVQALCNCGNSHELSGESGVLSSSRLANTKKQWRHLGPGGALTTSPHAIEAITNLSGVEQFNSTREKSFLDRILRRSTVTRLIHRPLLIPTCTRVAGYWSHARLNRALEGSLAVLLFVCNCWSE
jgi:hypothetical protein